jgi:toxin YoeB
MSNGYCKHWNVPGRRKETQALLNLLEKRLGLSKKKKKIPTKNLQLRVAVFQPEFREDLKYWVKTNRKVALRAFDLIEAIMRDPFTGIGKPEPLKFILSGVWSRRLTQEHRIVYTVGDDRIDFLQCRYHY